jgi:hypothetical protein
VKPQYEPKSLTSKLGYLVEECGEVLAAAGKSLRWGLESVNPEIPPEQQETNRDWLLRELADLDGAIQRVRAAVGEGPSVTLTRHEAQLLATFAYWTMAKVDRATIEPLLEKLGFPIPEGRTWPEVTK